MEVYPPKPNKSRPAKQPAKKPRWPKADGYDLNEHPIARGLVRESESRQAFVLWWAKFGETIEHLAGQALAVAASAGDPVSGLAGFADAEWLHRLALDLRALSDRAAHRPFTIGQFLFGYQISRITGAAADAAGKGGA